MQDPQIVKHGKEWYLITEKKGDIELTPLDPNRAYTVKDKTDNARTVKQNASMHSYFSRIAKSLNDGGFSVQARLCREGRTGTGHSAPAFDRGY